MAQNIDRASYSSVWKHRAATPKLHTGQEFLSYLGTFKRQYFPLTVTSTWRHKSERPMFRLALREYKALTPSFIPASGPIDPGVKTKPHRMNPKLKVIYRVQIGPKTRPC